MPQPPSRRFAGLVVTDHELPVPLDHDDPAGRSITVFGREVVRADRESDSLPWLVFLQGGPGYEALRPVADDGWLGRAVEDYRVLLLDQRGTGRSAPLAADTLGALDPEAQARTLGCFRADSIVRDAELVRQQLAGEAWTVLGQSYGGFCAVHYLSAAPEGLAGALIAGGLPPLSASAEEIYRRTYPLVQGRNAVYYERYPEDVARVRDLVRCLAEREVRLPCGDRLTPQRFQSLGLLLGFSDGFELIHYLVESAFAPGCDGPTYAFLRGFEGALGYDTHPIFSLLHEACYTQGEASRWAASRVRAEFPEFDPLADGPVLLTGEMIYPWMFEEIGALRPLRAAAELLAQREDWPALYDAEALRRNTVPCAAAIYVDDMYVERAFSEETAATIGGLSPWITNELLHNGLRSDGRRVLGKLLELVR